MKMKYFGIVIFATTVFVLVGCGPKEPVIAVTTVAQNENSADVQKVQSDVSYLLKAVYASDVDTVLGYTHPKIIALMGGAVQATNILKQSLLQFQTSGMQLESLTFPSEPVFLKSVLHQFALVPTKNIIVIRGQRIESLNYQFGVKEAGVTNWTYIEGSRVNSTNVNKFFPDFPSNYQFPDTYRKKL